MSKKKRKRLQQPVKCKTPECSQPPAPGSKYCPLCDMTVKFQRQVDKSNRRGDTIGALVNTGLAFLFNGIRQGNIAAPSLSNPMGAIHQQQRPRRPQQRPPGAGQPDPFVVLGLDPATATEKDVKRIQRGAAQMWHEDTGAKSPQAQARLAEINAAAVACINSIRTRDER